LPGLGVVCFVLKSIGKGKIVNCEKNILIKAKNKQARKSTKSEMRRQSTRKTAQVGSVLSTKRSPNTIGQNSKRGLVA
jgi:hypothetical protein